MVAIALGLVAVSVLMGVGAIALAITRDVPWWYVALGLLVCSIPAIIAISYYSSLRTNIQRRHALLGMMETATGMDINRDGIIGNPVGATTIRIEVTETRENGNVSRIAGMDWPIAEDLIPAVSAAILSGRMAESDWNSNTAINRTQFQHVRRALMVRGYGRWVNEQSHSLGWTLTGQGRAVLRTLAALSHPTESTKGAHR